MDHGGGGGPLDAPLLGGGASRDGVRQASDGGGAAPREEASWRGEAEWRARDDGPLQSPGLPPEQHQVAAETERARREARPLTCLVLMSAGFFFIFSAYYTVQEYVPSLIPGGLGDESLLLVYISLTLGALLLAPAIVGYVGEAKAMVLGGMTSSWQASPSICASDCHLALVASPADIIVTEGAVVAGLTFVIYMGSMIWPVGAVILASSALLGCGSGVLWVAQGTYFMKSCPPEKRGAYSGVFWGVLYSCTISGNAFAAFIFQIATQATLFAIFALMGLLGVGILSFLPDLSKEVEMPCTPSEGGEETIRSRHSTMCDGSGEEDMDSAYEGVHHGLTCGGGVGLSVVVSVPPNKGWTLPSSKQHGVGCPHSRLTTLLLYFLLSPMILYSGAEGSFWSGQYTKLLPQNTIGMVLLVLGIGQVAGSLILGGWMSDRFGCQTPTFLIGAMFFSFGLYVCIPLYRAAHIDEILEPTWLGAPVISYVGAAGLGIGDGVFNVCTYLMMGRLFPADDSEAWAILNVLQSGGSALSYAVALYSPIVGPQSSLLQLWIQAGGLLLGTILYVLVDALSTAWDKFRAGGRLEP
eukprot:SM000279S10389  [mRNA]  locus=s279:135326:139872:+ [translate_table: standard]